MPSYITKSDKMTNKTLTKAIAEQLRNAEKFRTRLQKPIGYAESDDFLSQASGHGEFGIL